ncbi:hypothetical protein APHAL10511_005474 [Amanita phalloides]|nr:hypothetical protein APHAL10511_005474 [Amanita phalloides]
MRFAPIILALATAKIAASLAIRSEYYHHDGYKQNFRNLNDAIEAPDYLTYILVSTLDECLAKCDSIKGCKFANTYNDVHGKNGSPLITCSLYKHCHGAEDATNGGGQTQPDGSVDYIIEPFFDSLSQLDTWASKSDEKLCNIFPYVPRNCVSDPNVANRGKLLVCHDFKGGYTESPESLSYTFNFWSIIDVFVYFSHHRVTIPPPAWINAAHRHGVKMLGVVLFEHEDHDADFRRLLSDPFSPNEENTFSGYHATNLADLAHQRGFDGFLLNFERPVPGGADQAGLLAVWIRLLREELWKKVGPHAEAIWYDSVTTTGKVKYQNKLNNLNLPFFLSSTGFFSNYFWKEEYPFDTMEYFLSLDSAIFVQNEQLSSSNLHFLTQRDIYIGIDVWGRGTPGGGGFCVHKAIEKISPHSLGLSVALFAPAWTWERRQDDMGRTWKAWWDEEVTFWAGKVPGLDLDKLLLANAMDQNKFLSQGKVPALDLDKLLLTNEEDRSAYKPVADFFVTKPPPDPNVLPFFTTFCPGVGNGWWVEGEKVSNGPEGDSQSWTSGWLDVEKSYSMGNLLWPIPTVSRCEEAQSDTLTEPALPSGRVSINLTDAWNGGSSVKLSFLQSESGMDDYCSLWIPVQSLSLTPGEDYTATAAYKLENMENGADVDVELQIRPVKSVAVLERMNQDASYSLKGSWSGLRTSIRMQQTGNDSHPVEVALGLKLNIRGRVSAKQQLFSVTLGQLTVYASQREWSAANDLRFNATDVKEDVLKNHEFEGVLTWEVSGDNSSHYRPAYWNIYVEPSPSCHSVKEDVKKIPGNAIWIGTSGVEYGGGPGSFVVTGRNLTMLRSLPGSWEAVGKSRFFIQAVTCCGEIAGEATVLYTDVDIKRES